MRNKIKTMGARRGLVVPVEEINKNLLGDESVHSSPRLLCTNCRQFLLPPHRKESYRSPCFDVPAER